MIDSRKKDASGDGETNEHYTLYMISQVVQTFTPFLLTIWTI